MDAKRNQLITQPHAEIPQIERKEKRAPAKPSALLNLSLAAAWIAFEFYLVATRTEAVEESLPFVVDAFAYGMSYFVTFGILGVIALAAANHRATSILSMAVGAGFMSLGAACGLIGHSVSSWGPGTLLAGGIAAASAAVFARS